MSEMNSDHRSLPKERCTNPEVGKLIHAYELSLLSEKDMESFEIHLLRCDHCYNEVTAFFDVARALEEDDEIQALVATSEAAHAGSEIWRKLWPERALLLRPAFAWVIVVLLVFPAFLGVRSLVDPEQPESSGVIEVEQSLLFSPMLGGVEQTEASADTRWIQLSFQYTDAQPGDLFSIAVDRVKGKDLQTVWNTDAFDSFDRIGFGKLMFPASLLPPGEYRLTIAPVDSATESHMRIYYFSVIN
jgi:hypothetical protein